MTTFRSSRLPLVGGFVVVLASLAVSPMAAVAGATLTGAHGDPRGGPGATPGFPGPRTMAPRSLDGNPGPPELPGVTSILVGKNPEYAAVDPQNGFVYVTNWGSGTVSVIDGTEVVATVGVGVQPLYISYDGENGWLYVSNDDSQNVSVINGTAVVASVPVGGYPELAIPDPRNGWVYVPDRFSDEVTVINGSRVIGSVAVGVSPRFGTWDAANGFVYVPNYDSDNVSVINGTTLVGSVPVRTNPQFAVYDPQDGDVYVSNSGDYTVSVLNGTDEIAAVITGTDPSWPGYDSGSGWVYVPNSGSNTVSALSGTSVVGTASAGNAPVGVAYDAGNDRVYATNEYGNTLSVIAGTRLVGTVAVGPSPLSTTYDDENGYLYVTDSASENVTVVPTWAVVSFNETGLVPGTVWSVDLGGNRQTSGYSSISFREPNGTYEYLVSTTSRYSVAPASGSVVVAGSDITLGVTFTSFDFYNVTFSVEGLSPGTIWSLTFAGAPYSSSAPSLTFRETNGTYPWALGGLPSWSTPTYSGAITVNGSDVSQPIPWTQWTYPVMIVEYGLPNGWAWWLNITGGSSFFSRSAVLSFSEPNGSFAYTVTARDRSYAAPGGEFRVTGSWAYQSITFSRVTYTVQFREAGLAEGTNWSVRLGGVLSVSPDPTIAFIEPNGTYGFSIDPPSGYAANLTTGSITVDGRPVTGKVSFAPDRPPVYSVTFSASGLGDGTVWTVTFHGETLSGTGSLTFTDIGNGTYPFSIAPVAGYAVVPRVGSVVVDGTSTERPIAFSSTAALPTEFLGLPAAVGYAVLGTVAAAVVVADLVAAGWSRRGKPHRRPVLPARSAP